MDFHALTLGQRNTYSGANGLTLLLTFMAVAALANSAATFGLVLAAAVTAGLWLTAWSLLVYDLVDAGDRWIGSLVFLATLGCLLAAWADSVPTLIGAAGCCSASGCRTWPPNQPGKRSACGRTSPIPAAWHH